jgi:hypothetical protein
MRQGAWWPGTPDADCSFVAVLVDNGDSVLLIGGRTSTYASKPSRCRPTWRPPGRVRVAASSAASAASVERARLHPRPHVDVLGQRRRQQLETSTREKWPTWLSQHSFGASNGELALEEHCPFTTNVAL